MTTQTAQFSSETSASGAFMRQPNAFTDRITADGSSGFPAQAGRYHLYVSLACPWSHRQVIVRKLKGLEDVITMSVVDPIRDERGWRFTEGPGHSPDPVAGFEFLREAYLATDPAFEGRVTVPVLWDRERQRIVSNDFPAIDVQLNDELNAFAKHAEIDLYPPALRPEIDEVGEAIYHDVNNGVYKAGFATSQAAYEEAFDALFARLDWLDKHLGNQRYLVDDQLTLADVRLFVTLVRFDDVYYSHFKCNQRRLVDYPTLWSYARDLYQRAGFGETVNYDHIKRHYYQTHRRINPTRIVPKGPQIDWEAPHERDRLGPA